MSKKTVFIVLTGRVHGVGYRFYALEKANQLGITGWVRNTRDGNVELEASGEPDTLSIFIDWIKIGPPRSIIKTISVTEIPNERTFTKFIIN